MNDSVEVTVSGTLLPARTVQIPPDESYTVILDHGISVTHHSQRHKGLFVHAAGGKRVKVVAVNEESGSMGVVSSIPTAFPSVAVYDIILYIYRRKVICTMQIYIDHARLIMYRLSNDDNCNSNFLIISVNDILIYTPFLLLLSLSLNQN